MVGKGNKGGEQQTMDEQRRSSGELQKRQKENRAKNEHYGGVFSSSFIIITQRLFYWLLMATAASKNLGRVCSVFQIPEGLLHLFVQFVVIVFDFGLSVLNGILQEKIFFSLITILLE